ncbi:MAG: replication-relaxation family protein [Arthrospira platensis]
MCPVACPLASSSTPRKAAPGRDFCEIRTPKDWPSQIPLSRISPARLDHISTQLTPTDKDVVRLVARARLCSAAQLERLFWHEGAPASRGRQARRALSRLVTWRLLDRLPRMVGGRRAGSRGFIYSLGTSGVRLLARQDGRRVRRLSAPGDRYVRHTLAVSDLYTELVSAERAGHADLIAFDFEPRCWARFPGAWGVTLTLKADAYVKLGIGGDYEYSWLIEIDMATESLPTIERKSRRHLDYHRSGTAQRTTGVAPRVLWVTPDAKRAEAIETVLRRLPAEAPKLFAVTTAPDAASFLTSEVRQ